MKFKDDGSFEWAWSPGSAWWLGVTWGDGNVYQGYNDNRVSVCGSYSTVRRWLNLIAPHKNPQEFKRSEGTFQGIWISKVLVEWFKSTYSICGKKSDNLPWPESMPPELYVHFFRGLFDSDGSLGPLNLLKEWTASNSVQPVVSFSSLCEPFVKRLLQEIKKAVPALEGSKSDIYLNKSPISDAPNHVFKYTGTYAYALADYLYKDCPPLLVNDDRLKVYDQFKEVQALKALPCVCGKVVNHEGMCQQCWWNKHGRETGSGTLCPCEKGKPILAEGMCTACYNRKRRASPDFIRKSTGTCGCGKPAYRKGLCDPCYLKERRKMKAAGPV